VARQVCRSLTEAHGAGVIHRDIKPANLFLTRVAGELDFVKVVDFGLAKVQGPGPLLTQSVIVGTPHYIAPELWRGRPADVRSDLYALGATLYHLLAGEEPFGDLPDLPAMARAHVEVEPAPLSSRPGLRIPASLEAVTMRCLRKEPESRYGSAAELLAAIEACDVDPWTPSDARQAWQDAALEGELWGAEPESGEPLERTLKIQ
jgi:serine/threonine-protein kinase